MNTKRSTLTVYIQDIFEAVCLFRIVFRLLDCIHWLALAMKHEMVEGVRMPWWRLTLDSAFIHSTEGLYSCLTLNWNKAKAISADLLDLNLKIQLYSSISVLVISQYWWHLCFGEFSLLVTFQFWWHFSFVDISVLVTFQFWWRICFSDIYFLVTFYFCDISVYVTF